MAMSIKIGSYKCSESETCRANKCIHKDPHSTDGLCWQTVGCSYSKTAVCVAIDEEWDK